MQACNQGGDQLLIAHCKRMIHMMEEKEAREMEGALEPNANKMGQDELMPMILMNQGVQNITL
jgi:hypothetical protein